MCYFLHRWGLRIPKEWNTQDVKELPSNLFHKAVPILLPPPNIRYLIPVRQPRQKPSFPTSSEAGWCTESREGKACQEFISIWKKPFQGFICSKSSLNILNKARWSVSGTVSILNLSPLLEDTGCASIHITVYGKALIFTLANPFFLSFAFCPNIVAETITHKLKQLGNFQIYLGETQWSHHPSNNSEPAVPYSPVDDQCLLSKLVKVCMGLRKRITSIKPRMNQGRGADSESVARM